MTPTTKLRFVERDQYVGLHEVRIVRILQQWYVPIGGDRTSDHYKGEWRDIPMEKEHE